MNPVKALEDHGQSVWLDFLARGFIAKGRLKKLIDEDGVHGVTSNPSIFEKAIAHSDEYDAAIARALGANDRSVAELYEGLAVEDIKHAADVLRAVFDARHGADGFVSIEVSPYLAMDTQRSIAEARRLWSEGDRKNLMVKIPATPAGLPAIQALTAEGINVNITLLFSQKVYEQVVEAYLCGLEALAVTGGDLSHVASVASFFVSRIDGAVDKLLDEKIAQANDPDEKARLGNLKGKVAIANAKLAYQRYKRLFAGERWNILQAKGAKPQRLLWASTGTKNKAYSDVLYVEELIGKNTVDTMPPATLDAFRDHGKVRNSLEENVEDAQRVLGDLSRAGISLDAVTDKLVEDGVQLFADAADTLLGAVAKKRTAVLGGRVDKQMLALGAHLETTVHETVEEWRAKGNIRRLFRRDKSLWTNADEDKWLGWLDSVEASLDQVGAYEAFAQDVKREGFTDALLLGMGGSSLGPEVLAQTFGHKSGWPKLRILDSTDPAQIKAIDAEIDVGKTLFIVSSKSGSTTEPNILKDYFYKRVADTIGRDKAGGHFVAITDPGSALERTAKVDRFRRIFHGVPSIGGRYSVLSPFGLVPAAAAGIDIAHLLKTARIMVRSCGPDVPPADNPGVALGIALGVAGRDGRDKVTLLASPRLADFGAWAEQLIAESTGKNGKGLIPVDAEPLGDPDVYGADRFFVDLRTEEETDPGHHAALAKIEQAGHPVVRIVLESVEHIGQEFFRFEIAIAVAGALLGINPFDQPDVEASKVKTRELTAAFETAGALPPETPVFSGKNIDIYTDATNAEILRKAGGNGSVEEWLKAHFARIGGGDYAALLAYVARDTAHAELLQKLRLALRDRRHVATCLGFGPRFLHSTGQAYKGGPNSGVFLQITADDADDLAIPGHAASFGVVKAAQARGDFDVLTERGRRALRVHLKGDVESGLSALDAAIRRAVG
jgi:transaldolase / glucose-6-phosphate isomerase